jgi:Tol biopolymer transport system component
MKNRALFVSIFGLLLAGLASAQPNVPGAPHSIAFHSNRDSGSAIHQIYVMNPDGSDQSRVTNNLSFNDQSVDISPDGTQIAFASNRAGGHFEIFAMDSNGSNVRQLTFTSVTTTNAWPRWSPSGEWIAFHSGSGANFQINLIKPDGTGLTTVTTYAGLNQYPAWSPDGTRLAIRRDNNLYVISLDANLHEASAVQLTDTPGFINQMASFSPDGTKLAYMSTRFGGFPSVLVRPAEGGLAADSQAAQLDANPGSPAANWTSRAPTWSPNGQYIYFTGKRPNTNNLEELFVRRADGTGDTEQLTFAGANAEAAVRHVVPPTITSAVPSATVLWPPDNSMSPVSLTVDVSDVSDPAPACQITDVVSSEPINAEGWEITGPLTLNLLAQRMGSGVGRKYTITVTCTNSSQLSSTATVTVFVPHDLRK